MSVVTIVGCRSDAEPGSRRNAPTSETKQSATGDQAPIETFDILPAKLQRSRDASVVIGIGETGTCSATKVADELLLSAAHCLMGYTGDEYLGEPWFEQNGQRHPLTVAEIGDFKPGEGRFDDWALLAVSDKQLLAELPSAPLVSAQTLERRLSSLSDELDDASVPVWTITFPAPSYRRPPRTPMQGERFTSRGFLKSPTAYRKFVALAVDTGVVYEERDPPPAPDVPANFEEIWRSAPDETLREIYESYEKGGNLVIHHSADYAPGSSGGGVFLEETGELIGIIPFGSSVVSRQIAYPGFGQLYRVDAVCRGSNLLSCNE